MSRRIPFSSSVPSSASSPVPPPPRLTLRLLQRRAYAVKGCGWIFCRLWALCPDPRRGNRPTVYAVGMDGGGMRRLYRVGHDETEARRIFGLLVRHTVTPIGLRDVLEELTDGG